MTAVFPVFLCRGCELKYIIDLLCHLRAELTAHLGKTLLDNAFCQSLLISYHFI